jgi:hypothetical protein
MHIRTQFCGENFSNTIYEHHNASPLPDLANPTCRAMRDMRTVKCGGGADATGSHLRAKDVRERNPLVSVRHPLVRVHHCVACIAQHRIILLAEDLTSLVAILAHPIADVAGPVCVVLCVTIPTQTHEVCMAEACGRRPGAHGTETLSGTFPHTVPFMQHRCNSHTGSRLNQ